ncbi:hypothetical protein SFRURICE_005391 [Spodoptera frugiperda]|nr:hypothetical protein SFRURICE_005391 [Spodoptera frugiperda]
MIIITALNDNILNERQCLVPDIAMEAGFIPVSAGNGGNAPQVNSVVAPPANVIRAPGLKRGKMEEAISDRGTIRLA